MHEKQYIFNTRTTNTAPKVANGDATIECVDGSSESVDFETLFRLRLSEKLDALFAKDKDLLTQFVLVPSLRDVFHEFVYPQVTGSIEAANKSAEMDAVFSVSPS